MTTGEFHEAVLKFCAAVQASTTSGQRTTAHNAKVGGVVMSAHRFGLAVDVVYDAVPPLPLAVDTARRLGLLCLREDDHDHLQPLSWEKG